MIVTSAQQRIFVSHLAGVSVFDPNGDQVGRLRDVLVHERPPPAPPRVLGFVIEVRGRRRVFMPMTRVTRIDAGQIVTTGLISMRRFERRATETLVLGELLDRTGALVATGEPVTVLDVAIEPTRARDWLLSQAYVRKGAPRRGLRRGGETLTVPWSAVSGLSANGAEQSATALVATYEQMRAADLAHALHDLPAARRTAVADSLDDERLADVVQELAIDEQVEIVRALGAERATLVLEAMDPDDAADLLAELPDGESERLLEMMEPSEAAPVRRLLVYSDDTAGGIMTPEPIVLPPDAVVAEALARVRNPDLTPALASQVYVCRPPTDTPTGRYLGIVHFQRLLREPPATLVGAVVDSSLSPIGPDMPLPMVSGYLAAYNMVAAPVVDPHNHLLGAVTVDDVLDHLLPEDWRNEQPAAELESGGDGRR